MVTVDEKITLPPTIAISNCIKVTNAMATQQAQQSHNGSGSGTGVRFGVAPRMAYAGRYANGAVGSSVSRPDDYSAAASGDGSAMAARCNRAPGHGLYAGCFGAIAGVEDDRQQPPSTADAGLRARYHSRGASIKATPELRFIHDAVRTQAARFRVPRPGRGVSAASRSHSPRPSTAATAARDAYIQFNSRFDIPPAPLIARLATASMWTHTGAPGTCRPLAGTLSREPHTLTLPPPFRLATPGYAPSNSLVHTINTMVKTHWMDPDQVAHSESTRVRGGAAMLEAAVQQQQQHQPWEPGFHLVADAASQVRLLTQPKTQAVASGRCELSHAGLHCVGLHMPPRPSEQTATTAGTQTDADSVRPRSVDMSTSPPPRTVVRSSSPPHHGRVEFIPAPSRASVPSTAPTSPREPPAGSTTITVGAAAPGQPPALANSSTASTSHHVTVLVPLTPGGKPMPVQLQGPAAVAATAAAAAAARLADGASGRQPSQAWQEPRTSPEYQQQQQQQQQRGVRARGSKSPSKRRAAAGSAAGPVPLADRPPFVPPGIAPPHPARSASDTYMTAARDAPRSAGRRKPRRSPRRQRKAKGAKAPAPPAPPAAAAPFAAPVPPMVLPTGGQPTVTHTGMQDWETLALLDRLTKVMEVEYEVSVGCAVQVVGVCAQQQAAHTAVLESAATVRVREAGAGEAASASSPSPASRSQRACGAARVGGGAAIPGSHQSPPSPPSPP